MNSVLVLHHFELFWEEAMKRFGTSFHEELMKIIDFIDHTSLSRVIVTRFEGWELGEEHAQLQSICNSKGIRLDCFEYGYGWEKDSSLDESRYPESELNTTWCYGTRDYHDGVNDIVEIHEWHHELRSGKSHVYLAGAFEGECIADMQAVFDAIEVSYENVRQLVVGSNTPYSWKGLTPDILQEEVCSDIRQMEKAIGERSKGLYDNLAVLIQRTIIKNRTLIDISGTSLWSENEALEYVLSLVSMGEEESVIMEEIEELAAMVGERKKRRI